MAMFYKFENIIDWQKTKELCKMINWLTYGQNFSANYKRINFEH